KRLLYWGSGFAAIRVQELAPDRIHLAPGSQPTDLLVPSTRPYEKLIEGAWMHEHGGFFYLFSSGDDCCGSATAPPHYAVMVSRAKSPTGPFEDFGPVTGAPDDTILVGNSRWLGPGHNAVVVDDAGTEWMVYHSFDTTKPGGRMLLIDPITYVDGWPRIAGRSPSTGTQKAGPVFRH
ncbi:MAG: family 43 glycosylhydrolase, partial [Polyangiaceae bacterium]